MEHNLEYIIVQAGGKGTRLEHLTANRPKALVPVDNLPMLFHLFRKYPKAKFLVIADYKADVMEKYLEAFADVKYLVVNANGHKGTCAGLREALRKIPGSKPFMLIWSDLVLPKDFALPEETDNYIGLSKDFPCRWKYENDCFEEEKSSEYGVAGMFIFKDKTPLLEVPVEGEFVRWLQSQKFTAKTLGLYKTHEYGLLSVYNDLQGKKDPDNSKSAANNQQLDSCCRPFNKIQVTQAGDEERIVKEGIDAQGAALAVREVAWYRYAVEHGITCIPRIYEYQPLVMQKINGHNVFNVECDDDEKKRIIDRLVACLKSLHQTEHVEPDYFSIYDAYVGKTFQRLDKIRNMVPYANEKIININGRNCRNVFFHRDEVIKAFRNYSCEAFCFIHGDCTFSNTMISNTGEPVLIDPRGYFGFTELFGDPNYDWAKLYYSIAGNYDQFNLKRFRLRFLPDQAVEIDVRSNGWEHLTTYFLDQIQDCVDERTIKLIHAIIWLSLTTYAWEDYDSICAAFYIGLYHLEEVL